MHNSIQIKHNNIQLMQDEFEPRDFNYEVTAKLYESEIVGY